MLIGVHYDMEYIRDSLKIGFVNGDLLYDQIVDQGYRVYLNHHVDVKHALVFGKDIYSKLLFRFKVLRHKDESLEKKVVVEMFYCNNYGLNLLFPVRGIQYCSEPYYVLKEDQEKAFQQLLEKIEKYLKELAARLDSFLLYSLYSRREFYDKRKYGFSHTKEEDLQMVLYAYFQYVIEIFYQKVLTTDNCKKIDWNSLDESRIEKLFKCKECYEIYNDELKELMWDKKHIYEREGEDFETFIMPFFMALHDFKTLNKFILLSHIIKTFIIRVFRSEQSVKKRLGKVFGTLINTKFVTEHNFYRVWHEAFKDVERCLL